MMGRALLIIGAMATLGFVATAVIGYTLADPADAEVPLHLLVGLASSLLLLFSHCWIMFYLIGTGKAIKEAVQEHGLDKALIEDTKRFKNKSYPSLMLAMILGMATFILGGGVVPGALPSWIHHALFYATLLVQGRALWFEKQVLEENERLIADIDRRLASTPPLRPAIPENAG
jgi:MFS family permease